MKPKHHMVLIAALAALSLTSCGGGAAGGGTGTDELQGETEQPRSDYVEITDQQGSIEGFVGAIDGAVVERCESDGSSWKAAGTVTNPESVPQSYRLYVAFNENRDTHGLVQVDVEDVAGGASQSWETEAPIDGERLSCILRVERFAPQS